MPAATTLTILAAHGMCSMIGLIIKLENGIGGVVVLVSNCTRPGRPACARSLVRPTEQIEHLKNIIHNDEMNQIR